MTRGTGAELVPIDRAAKAILRRPAGAPGIGVKTAAECAALAGHGSLLQGVLAAAEIG